MRRRNVFWSLYAFCSLCTALISIMLFRLFTKGFDAPYEEAVLVAGILTMPINWLAGEQLTWYTRCGSRSIRAMRYFLVYGIGLLLNTLVIHWLGHVWRWDARVSEMFGLIVSMVWTGPMNRYFTWAKDIPDETFQT